jgi:hypothetical protein
MQNGWRGLFGDLLCDLFTLPGGRVILTISENERVPLKTCLHLHQDAMNGCGLFGSTGKSALRPFHPAGPAPHFDNLQT